MKNAVFALLTLLMIAPPAWAATATMGVSVTFAEAGGLRFLESGEVVAEGFPMQKTVICARRACEVEAVY
jgi:hypothetical protein